MQAWSKYQLGLSLNFDFFRIGVEKYFQHYRDAHARNTVIR